MEVLLVKKTFKLIGTGLLLLVFGSANAHYIVEDGEYTVSDQNFALFQGTPGTIGLDGDNEVLEGGTLDGYFGSELWVWGPIRMRYDLIGFESKNTVQFLSGSHEIFFDTEQFAQDDSLGTLSSPIDRSREITLGPFGGKAFFAFKVYRSPDESPFLISNGAGNYQLYPNIFMSMVDDPKSRYGNSVYLAFDENLDGDYDDMFVRLTDISLTDASIPTVPEPATLWLFGISLAGLGILRKRMMR